MIYQKFIMSLVAMGSVLFGGYFATLENKSSHTEPKTPTSAIVAGTGNNAQSGTESDTLKRLKTLSESGSSWGMTPFGSGKPLTEEDSQTKVSNTSKPYLVWKTRTIQLKDGRWVTYEFGKGNPSEVALSAEELKAAYKRCGSAEDPDSTGEFCGEQSGYVSKEVEQHLLAALSDPNWDRLLSECGEQLKYIVSAHSGDVDDMVSHALDSNFHEINTFVNVNENTGRKGLATVKIMGLRDLLRQSTFVVRNMYQDTQPYKNPTCVDVYGKEIMRNLDASLSYFKNPLEIFGPISPDVLDPKLYHIL